MGRAGYSYYPAPSPSQRTSKFHQQVLRRCTANTVATLLSTRMLLRLHSLRPRLAVQVPSRFLLHRRFNHTKIPFHSPLGAASTPTASCIIPKSMLPLFSDRSVQNKGEEETHPSHSSLRDLLLKVFDVSPQTVRTFLGTSDLTPEGVFRLLLSFEFDNSRKPHKNVAAKVGALWELFEWASTHQTRDFQHLPRSCELMASMLARVGSHRDAESLLATLEGRGVLLDNNNGVFDDIVIGYARDGDLERAIAVCDRMRLRGLVHSLSSACFCALLDLLVQANETQLAFRVCLDVSGRGFQLTAKEAATCESVIRLLCEDAKIQQARNLTIELLPLGFHPSSLVMNLIVRGYFGKNDFQDILSFYAVTNQPPDILTGNTIIFQLCSKFGVVTADSYIQELMQLGFYPNAKTFEILIGWSFREGKSKRAFLYLSEILSRGLKPDVCSYNTIISGLFKVGMWMHAKEIIHEMVDMGVSPDLSTFKALLAGYCKTRKFEEVKDVIGEMVKHGLIPPSSLEDPLSNAFVALGLDPLAVKVKRDNDMGLVKTEFYDCLGNGLYLDADQDEYESTLARVLEDLLVVDFNFLVMQECGCGNLESALSVVEAIVPWGQELSLSAFSALVELVCVSCQHMRTLTSIFEQVPDLIYQLDEETLNLVVQAYCENRSADKGWIILKKMFYGNLAVKNETYTAVGKVFCNEANLKGILEFWDIARSDKWLPDLKEFRVFVGFLCRQKLLRKALELSETMVDSFPHLRADILFIFTEKLCVTRNTTIALRLVEELQWSSNLDPRSYCNFISGFCNEKRYSEALMIYDVMLAKKLAPCLDVVVLLIPLLCGADRFGELVSLKNTCLKIQPLGSFCAYASLISGFCKAGRIGEATIAFQDMLSKGLTPHSEICNAVVLGLCQVNDVRKTAELFGFMMRKHLILSLSSYRKLVRLMCMEGKILHALSLKEYMLRESSCSGIIIYNILIFHLLTTGKNLVVNTLLSEFQKRGLIPDEITYNFLVYGYFQCKDVSSTLHYTTTMISKGLQPNSRALRAAIQCLLDGGDLEGALALSQAMELRGWVHGSIVQNALVESLLTCGKVLEAENFLDRMDMKDLCPENINYDNLIKSFCSYGRLSKAVDLLNQMLKNGNIPISSSYDCVIQGCCVHNKLQEAANFHTEMLCRSYRPSIDTWTILIDGFSQNGQTAEAERLLISMVKIGEAPTSQMYDYVINRYRIENNFSKALELLQAMQQYGYKPSFETHWSLISNLSGSQDKDNGRSSQGFLARILGGDGFFQGKYANKC